MAVASVVLSLMLAALFLALGLAKLFKQASMVERTAHLGFSARACRLIGALEVAAISHRRAGDGPKEIVAPVWLALVATAATVVEVSAL